MSDRRWYLIALAVAVLFSIVYASQRDLVSRVKNRIETNRKLAGAQQEADKLEIEYIHLDHQVKELEKPGSTIEKERLIRRVKKYVRDGEIVFHLEPLDEMNDSAASAPAPEIPIPLPVPDPEAKDAGAPPIAPVKKH